MDNIDACLREHRFKPMFTELLGWDHASGQLDVSVCGRAFTLLAIAHKRGMMVLVCLTDRLALMNRTLLRRIERDVARVYHEHVLIFYAEEPCKQVWQWAVRRPDGKRLRHREHPFFSDRPPAGLLARLAGLRFTLDEEESASLVDALGRVRQALDVAAEQNLFTRRPRYAERSDALARAMQDGGIPSFHRFVLFHRRLARRISKRLCRWYGMRPEDAAQIAYLGLMRAARKFRPELGYQFSTYASHWIKQFCDRLGPDFAFLIRVPPHVLRACFQVRRQLDRIAVRIGPSAVRDFRAELELRDPQLARRFRDFELATGVRSLSDRRSPEAPEARQIAEQVTDFVDDAQTLERANLLNEALDRLRPRYAQVLRLRYGFDGCAEQTLTEIGALFGLTRERVRQIQQAAEKRLRNMIYERYPSLVLLEAPSGPEGELLTVSAIREVSRS